MTDHPWDDRLSEYLDGELAPADRVALEGHLTGCERCRTIVAELREVVAQARPLRDQAVPPVEDLWPGIMEGIAAEEALTPRRGAVRDIRRHPWFARRLSLSLPQAVAVAAAIMVVSGLFAWQWTSRLAPRPAAPIARNTLPSPGVGRSGASVAEPGARPQEEPTAVGSTPSAGSRRSRPPVGGTPAEMALAGFSDPRYDATIAELERVLQNGRGTLDTTTIRILEQNLAIIDRALDEARRAVAADPANTYLRDHLASTMRRKVDLLRRVTVIAGAQG